MKPAFLMVCALCACGPPGATGLEPTKPTDSTALPGSGGGSTTTVQQGLETVPDAWEAPSWDPAALPTDVPTVQIEIDGDAMARLDADPFLAPDERGVFIDGDGTRHEVDLAYRGAYQLQNVMNGYGLRNWKVKLDEDDTHLGRREWNFNYEPHFRQKLAYDLFRFAGVPVPGAEHVILVLNGVEQGVYLQYEDPDNERWLWDSFGNDDGDLYKAAYDLPGQPVCWADLSWLGDQDEDYDCHYNKKNNHRSAPDDLSVVRTFITELNSVGDEGFADWLETAVDTDRLLSYLVVSSFISNWDSYPQRPKNYWLYQDLRAEKMVYVPWDLDGTFWPTPDGTYNQVGSGGSVFYNLLEDEYTSPHVEEGDERPLVRRMMAIEAYQQAYLDRYQTLSESILSRAYLDDRLSALSENLTPRISATDQQRLASAESSMRTFIAERTATVEAELDALR